MEYEKCGSKRLIPLLSDVYNEGLSAGQIEGYAIAVKKVYAYLHYIKRVSGDASGGISFFPAYPLNTFYESLEQGKILGIKEAIAKGIVSTDKGGRK